MSGDSVPEPQFREVDPTRYVLTTNEEDVALHAAWKVLQALSSQNYTNGLRASTVLYLRSGEDERPGSVFAVGVRPSTETEDAFDAIASIPNSGHDEGYRGMLRAAVETVGIE